MRTVVAVSHQYLLQKRTALAIPDCINLMRTRASYMISQERVMFRAQMAPGRWLILKISKCCAATGRFETREAPHLLFLVVFRLECGCSAALRRASSVFHMKREAPQSDGLWVRASTS